MNPSYVSENRGNEKDSLDLLQVILSLSDVLRPLRPSVRAHCNEVYVRVLTEERVPITSSVIGNLIASSNGRAFPSFRHSGMVVIVEYVIWKYGRLRILHTGPLSVCTNMRIPSLELK